ncbi:hypothetical protein AXF42_Ash019578 [Apostasia shenzhenica]|uniref:Uncharacterized protein n=1 Tax=Apostasia shenzhenica TaxID=1088818 RepID=A0A2I0AV47_9ASPA|nr:hypothetical protein AXF42_Ash019578 [Apostasia shenzhenica]
MDSSGNEARNCNGKKPSIVIDSKEGVDKGKDEDGKRNCFLSSALKKGGMKGRRQRSRAKKVRWNDCNGDKLVEVMEFQPSDSSDSEDEYGSDDWILDHAIFGCIKFFCCLWGPR